MIRALSMIICLVILSSGSQALNFTEKIEVYGNGRLNAFTNDVVSQDMVDGTGQQNYSRTLDVDKADSRLTSNYQLEGNSSNNVYNYSIRRAIGARLKNKNAVKWEEVPLVYKSNRYLIQMNIPGSIQHYTNVNFNSNITSKSKIENIEGRAESQFEIKSKDGSLSEVVSEYKGRSHPIAIAGAIVEGNFSLKSGISKKTTKGIDADDLMAKMQSIELEGETPIKEDRTIKPAEVTVSGKQPSNSESNKFLNKKAYEEYQKGLDLVVLTNPSEENLTEAIKHFDDALQIDPSLKYAWYSKGTAQYNLKKYETAVKSFDEAINLDPSYLEALIAKADTLMQLKKNELAIGSYSAALSLNSSNARLWHNRAMAYYNIQKYGESLSDFKEAIERSGLADIDNTLFISSVYHRGLALKFLKQNNTNEVLILNQIGRNGVQSNLNDTNLYNRSLEIYNKALEVNQSIGVAWQGKGLALYKLNEYEQALESYKKAIDLGPKSVSLDSTIAAADTLMILKRYDEAINYYNDSISLKPKEVRLWNNYGKAQYYSGNFEAAFESFKKATEINPEYARAWFNRGLALFELNRYEEAVESFNTGIKLDPTQEDAFIKGKREEAEKIVSKISKNEINGTGVMGLIS